MILNIIILFSGISFIIYGITSFTSKNMILEYIRWGYRKQRYLIGAFQFIAGTCLIIGIFYPKVLSLASIFLTVIMSAAVLVRVNIKDGIYKMLPAILYAVLNFIIFYNSFLK